MIVDNRNFDTNYTKATSFSNSRTVKHNLQRINQLKGGKKHECKENFDACW